MTEFKDLPRPLSSICVFCGSKAGNRPCYAEVTEALAKELVQQQIQLVYGGGSIGLMGVLARTVIAQGGSVISIIPKALAQYELTGESIGELILVDTMHERKALMAQHSDAFITLPGGFGTLDELFEMVTWSQLGVQSKPVGLLNIDGYFDPQIQMIDQAVAEGFIRSSHRNLLVQSDDPIALIHLLGHQSLPTSSIQWNDPSIL